MATSVVPTPHNAKEAKKAKARLFACARDENLKNALRTPSKGTASKKAEDLHRNSILFGTPLRRTKRVKPTPSTDCRKSSYRQTRPTPGKSTVRFTPLSKPKRVAAASRRLHVPGPICPTTTPRAAKRKPERTAAVPEQDAFDIEFQADPDALSEILSSGTNLAEPSTPFEFRRQSSIFATPMATDMPVPSSAPARRRRDSIVGGEPLRVFKRRAAPSPATTTPMRTGRKSRGTPSRVSIGRADTKRMSVSHVQVAPSSLSGANLVLHRLEESPEAEKFATFSSAVSSTPVASSPLRSPVRAASASLPVARTPRKSFEAAARTPSAADSLDLIRRLSMGIESILKNPDKQFATPKPSTKKRRTTAKSRPAEPRTPLASVATPATVANAPAEEVDHIKEELRRIEAEEQALVKEIERLETPKRAASASVLEASHSLHA